MDKFGRNYRLRVQTDDAGGFVTISLPFTIEFDITRNILTSANVCQIRVINLSLINRNLIRLNGYDTGSFRAIELLAGYGDNLSRIFSGNISVAWSVREGTNFITQIECFDGGFDFVNGTTSTQFTANTAQQSVIAFLMKSLPTTKFGAVGNYPGNLARGNTYNGNTVNLLTELTGGGFFIDDGKAYALGTNEYIADLPAITISPQSGLIGTPVREQSFMRFEMIFEPSLSPGQQVILESFTENNFNGTYKVVNVKHRGMISEAVCGSVTTSGDFLFNKILTGVV